MRRRYGGLVLVKIRMGIRVRNKYTPTINIPSSLIPAAISLLEIIKKIEKHFTIIGNTEPEFFSTAENKVEFKMIIYFDFNTDLDYAGSYITDYDVAILRLDENKTYFTGLLSVEKDAEKLLKLLQQDFPDVISIK